MSSSNASDTVENATNSTIQHLAVYGTLRDDDDSGASWTKEFVKDVDIAESGQVIGAKMYRSPVHSWPFVILSDSPHHTITVRVLHWKNPLKFQEKLSHADEIEGYNPLDESKSEYVRRPVKVKLFNGSTIMAWIYVLLQKDDAWRLLRCGDWLKRHAEAVDFTCVDLDDESPSSSTSIPFTKRPLPPPPSESSPSSLSSYPSTYTSHPFSSTELSIYHMSIAPPTHSRIILIGDIHGCASEFQSLLSVLKYDKERDLCICVGDLVAKGPDSSGVIDTCMNNGILCVLGNHDVELLKCADYIGRLSPLSSSSSPPTTTPPPPSSSSSSSSSVAASASSSLCSLHSYTSGVYKFPPVYNSLTYLTRLDNMGKPASCRSNESEHMRLAHSLRDDQLIWLSRLPLSIRLEGMNTTIVHAGVVPNKQAFECHPRELMWMRNVNEDGTVTEAVDRGVGWTKVYGGPELIVFGHDARRGFQREQYAIGLDTGCVYGNELTSLVFPSKELFAVKAARVYTPPSSKD